VRAEVEKGDLIAALVIPAGFNESVNNAEPVELEVLKDPGSELSANIWESIIRSISIEMSRVSVVAQTAGQAVGTAVQEQGLPPQVIEAAIGSASLPQRQKMR